MRTIVEIPEKMLEDLDAISNAKRQARAVTVREAVREYLERNAKVETVKAFGLWRKRMQDGVKMQRELRNEWT